MEFENMSKRANPFEEMEELFDRMSSQFEEITGSEAPVVSVPSAGETVDVDLLERDDEYEVTVDLPGFEPDDVDVDVTEQMLQVAAEYEETEEDAEDNYLTRERRAESIRRSVRLPTAIDPDGATARMQNGVLTVTLPKASGGGTSVEVQ
jgi:HSP20 family protein